jgi:hypothetical protein
LLSSIHASRFQHETFIRPVLNQSDQKVGAKIIEDFSCEMSHSAVPDFPPVPAEDRLEFAHLQESFKSRPTRARHTGFFHDELIRILEFIHRRPQQCGQRGIATGLLQAGPYLCVNTQQLRRLTGRCKSSINIGLQQLGFATVKTKAPLAKLDDQSAERQWTVRQHIAFQRAIPAITVPRMTTPPQAAAREETAGGGDSAAQDFLMEEDLFQGGLFKEEAVE